MSGAGALVKTVRESRKADTQREQKGVSILMILSQSWIPSPLVGIGWGMDLWHSSSQWDQKRHLQMSSWEWFSLIQKRSTRKRHSFFWPWAWLSTCVAWTWGGTIIKYRNSICRPQTWSSQSVKERESQSSWWILSRWIIQLWNCPSFGPVIWNNVFFLTV